MDDTKKMLAEFLAKGNKIVKIKASESPWLINRVTKGKSGGSRGCGHVSPYVITAKK